MGFGLPAVAAERLLQRSWLPLPAVTELISRHSAWHWTAVQQKPQLVRARWKFLRRTAGWLNGREAPAPGGGAIAKHCLAPTLCQRAKPANHANIGDKANCKAHLDEEQLSDCMSEKGFQTHPGWLGVAPILITLYINCTLITHSCASEATDQEVFIQEMCTLMLERHLKMQKQRNGCNNSAQISVHSFCLTLTADTWLEKINKLEITE